jgi:hypothetical protein
MEHWNDGILGKMENPRIAPIYAKLHPAVHDQDPRDLRFTIRHPLPARDLTPIVAYLSYRGTHRPSTEFRIIPAAYTTRMHTDKPLSDTDLHGINTDLVKEMWWKP